MKAIFVYGTLKRGLENAVLLKGQHFLGEARTAARYRLVDCGGYPGLIDAEEGREGVSVMGEVWAVDGICLGALDRLEGIEAGLYRREVVDLVEAFADYEEVEGYFWNRQVENLREIASGEWRN
jgi:gamma-glutamylaminecyclotransferase